MTKFFALFGFAILFSLVVSAQKNPSLEKLKNLISVKYNLPYESLVFTDELPKDQDEPLK